MIVTVTANPAVDRTLVISGFRTGATNRAAVERVDAGGKGINVAGNLARLGCRVVATGLLGDINGHQVATTLAAHGITQDFVRVPGEVRTNIKIIDPATGVETEINEPGPPVSPEALEALVARIAALAGECSVMVFSGSLPPGAPPDLYARCIRLASAAGVKTVLDSAGAPLQYGIAATPDLVKPNRAEAEDLLRMRIRDERELAVAAQRLLERGARSAVISLGADGAVSASGEGLWRARLPRVAPHNTVGAGDAMVAGLAYALERCLPSGEALRLATALGSAAAVNAAPLPEHAVFEMFLPEISIESLPAVAASTGLPGLDA
jgi:1-phosphofructokinase